MFQVVRVVGVNVPELRLLNILVLRRQKQSERSQFRRITVIVEHRLQEGIVENGVHDFRMSGEVLWLQEVDEILLGSGLGPVASQGFLDDLAEHRREPVIPWQPHGQMAVASETVVFRREERPGRGKPALGLRRCHAHSNPGPERFPFDLVSGQVPIPP